MALKSAAVVYETHAALLETAKTAATTLERRASTSTSRTGTGRDGDAASGGGGGNETLRLLSRQRVRDMDALYGR
jgi:hypothetical protein